MSFLSGANRKPIGTYDPNGDVQSAVAPTVAATTAGSAVALSAAPGGTTAPVPNPSNSHNEILAAQAKLEKAKGRLGTIFTSNYGILPKKPVSLSRSFLTGV